MPKYYENYNQGIGNEAMGAGRNIMGQGEDLYNQLGGEAAYNQGISQGYQGQSDNLWNQYGAGYSQDQMSNILGLNSQGNGLAGVNPLQQSDIDSWQLTPGEQAGMMGNPNQVRDTTYANTSQLGTNIMTGNQNVNDAARSGQSMIMGSVNPQAFGQDPGYRQSLNNALGQEASSLGGAVNNPNLGLSNQFQQNYQFGQGDADKIVQSAGLAAGNQYQTQMDALQRQAAAQGNASPLAIAAMQQQMSRQQANAKSEAELNAQIQAKQLGLGVTQTGEQMRLGTAQDISSRQMQAGESLAGSQIGAANTAEQLRLQGLSQGQGLGLSAASQAAGLGTNAAQFGAGQLNQGTEFATNANLQAGQYADQAGASRAAGIAQNRQNVAMTGQNQQFNQGMGVNQQMSNRYNSVYGQNQQFRGQQAGAMQNNQQFYAGQTGQNFNQQTGAINAQTGAMSAGYGLGLRGAQQAYGSQQPGLGSTLLNAGIGALGAFAKASG